MLIKTLCVHTHILTSLIHEWFTQNWKVFFQQGTILLVAGYLGQFLSFEYNT